MTDHPDRIPEALPATRSELKALIKEAVREVDDQTHNRYLTKLRRAASTSKDAAYVEIVCQVLERLDNQAPQP